MKKNGMEWKRKDDKKVDFIGYLLLLSVHVCICAGRDNVDDSSCLTINGRLLLMIEQNKEQHVER